MSDQTVWKAAFNATPADADWLAETLELLAGERGIDFPTFSWNEIEEDSGTWIMEGWFVGNPGEEFIKTWLDRAGLAGTTFELAVVEDRDWVAESQKLLNPVRAGRYFIFGAHDADQAKADTVNLQIDAGQAFGTGKHETTSGCLTILDKLADTVSPTRVLDLGTGSGVLGLAAAKTWPCKVLGSDIDPVSIEVAAPNAPLNGVNVRTPGEDKPGYAAVVADGPHGPAFDADGPFELVFANILAEPLIHMATDIAAVIEPGGLLILAGLLVEQESEVRDAYSDRGLELVDRVQSGNWPTLLMRKAISQNN